MSAELAAELQLESLTTPERLSAQVAVFHRRLSLARDDLATCELALALLSQIAADAKSKSLTRLRLHVALHALHKATGSLTELSLQVGFSSHSHFTSAFRAEFGVPPSRMG